MFDDNCPDYNVKFLLVLFVRNQKHYIKLDIFKTSEEYKRESANDKRNSIRF